MTIEPQRRNTVRGRPKVTDGSMECARCHREMRRTAATWPDGRICNSRYYEATSLYGDCPSCGFHRLPPGRLDIGEQPVCRDHVRVSARTSIAGRATRSADSTVATYARAAVSVTISREHFWTPTRPLASLDSSTPCAADRAESIITWKRSDKIQVTPPPPRRWHHFTHDGLDQYEPAGRHVDHLRAILQHHDVLPARDKYLAYFERWIEEKLRPVSDAEIAKPTRQFATWHHLKRINELALAGKPTRGPVHASKQDITEAPKFPSGFEPNMDERSPTARSKTWTSGSQRVRPLGHLIRTFIIWCKKMRVNRSITLGHRQAKTVRVLTQDQRLEWIRELLSGDSESLPYRVAGTLLLLYAQPLVKVAAIPMSKVLVAPDGLSLELGATPSPVPEPFAELLKSHITNRPNLRTAGADNPWLFPGYRPGEHLHPNTLMDRLRWLGMDLLGARNTALRELVTQVPPPVVAEMLRLQRPGGTSACDF